MRLIEPVSFIYGVGISSIRNVSRSRLYDDSNVQTKLTSSKSITKSTHIFIHLQSQNRENDSKSEQWSINSSRAIRMTDWWAVSTLSVDKGFEMKFNYCSMKTRAQHRRPHRRAKHSNHAATSFRFYWFNNTEINLLGRMSNVAYI